MLSGMRALTTLRRVIFKGSRVAGQSQTQLAPEQSEQSTPGPAEPLQLQLERIQEA